MYDCHYNYVMKKFKRAKLLFTDTDSLTYHIPTKNIYDDIMKDKERFDLSKYDPKSKYFDLTNKDVTGKFKDETAGSVIKKFVGLRAKCYSYIIEKFDSHEQANDKRCNGIKKNVVKDEMTHAMYESVLMTKEQIRKEMNCIRSENMEMSSVVIRKAALTSFDDKRYILPDGITTLSYGNVAIDR